MTSKFMEWFVAQHGSREFAREHDSDTDLEQAIANGASAECELARRKRWDACKTSALWAWQACSPDQGSDKP